MHNFEPKSKDKRNERNKEERHRAVDTIACTFED